MKIGIDLDTTLNNLNEVWLKRYNEDYNDNMEYWSDWDVEKIVKPECGNKIFDYLSEPGFFYNLNIRDNAQSIIDSLIDEGHEIYIVTAYRPKTCVDKVKWVKKYLPRVNSENVIFINNKSLLNLDILIDDAPHNIESFKNKTIIFDAPYNKNLKGNRIFNWNEVKQFIIN